MSDDTVRLEAKVFLVSVDQLEESFASLERHIAAVGSGLTEEQRVGAGMVFLWLKNHATKDRQLLIVSDRFVAAKATDGSLTWPRLSTPQPRTARRPLNRSQPMLTGIRPTNGRWLIWTTTRHNQH